MGYCYTGHHIRYTCNPYMNGKTISDSLEPAVYDTETEMINKIWEYRTCIFHQGINPMCGK